MNLPNKCSRAVSLPVQNGILDDVAMGVVSEGGTAMQVSCYGQGVLFTCIVHAYEQCIKHIRLVVSFVIKLSSRD